MELVKEAYPVLNEFVAPYQESIMTSASTTSINDLMDKMSRGEIVDIPKSTPTEPKKKSKKSEDNNPLSVLGDIHTTVSEEEE